jgi:ribosomal protein S18 acetylase RimI-like enzyme
MDLRPMRDQDLDAVTALYLAAYRSSWSESAARKYLEKFYRFEPESCFVATESDDSISAAILAYSYEKEERHVLFIQELFVHPGHRNAGYGKRLVTRLRESIKGPSQVRIKPLVKADTSVLNFYNSLGFERDKAVNFSFEED